MKNLINILPIATMLALAATDASAQAKGEVGYSYTNAFGGTNTIVSKNVTNTIMMQIDCYDSSASNAGTKDAISVDLIKSDGSVIRTKQIRNARNADSNLLPVFFEREMTAPNCNFLVDAKYMTGELNIAPTISAVKVTISGSDALWIDEARLIKNTITRTRTKEVSEASGTTYSNRTRENETLLRKWGSDGKKGYCMSTNPQSVKEFPNLSSNCSATRTFNVKTGKVTKPRTSAPVRNYEVGIKTADSRGAGTDSNIHLFMHGSKGVVSGSTGVLLNPKISGNAFERDDLDTVKLNSLPDMGAIRYVTLKSDGKHRGADWEVSYVTVNGKKFDCKNQEIEGAGKIDCH